MMLFKACPHCLKGDLVVEREHGALMVCCLQCGYTGELRSVYPWHKLTPQVVERPSVAMERVTAA